MICTPSKSSHFLPGSNHAPNETIDRKWINGKNINLELEVLMLRHIHWVIFKHRDKCGNFVPPRFDTLQGHQEFPPEPVIA